MYENRSRGIIDRKSDHCLPASRNGAKAWSYLCSDTALVRRVREAEYNFLNLSQATLGRLRPRVTGDHFRDRFQVVLDSRVEPDTVFHLARGAQMA